MIRIQPADRTGSIRRGGRAIGWREFGIERGIPVVFCTGAAMTSSLGFGADAIAELGIRLLCIDRAGLGLSEPDPNKTLESYARDVEAVLLDQRLTRPAVLGFSQGAPFAVALVGAGLGGALSLVSAQDELAHPAVRRALVPEVAQLVDAIEADPRAFEAAFATRVDADGMWSLIMGTSAEVDRAIYGEPAFEAAFRATLAEGFARGPSGYVRDLVLAMSRWSTPPERIDAPVQLWYGRRDTSPVHSPDFAATLAARFPRASQHVLDEEGGSLLWTRSGEILRALIAAS